MRTSKELKKIESVSLTLHSLHSSLTTTYCNLILVEKYHHLTTLTSATLNTSYLLVCVNENFSHCSSATFNLILLYSEVRFKFVLVKSSIFWMRLLNFSLSCLFVISKLWAESSSILDLCFSPDLKFLFVYDWFIEYHLSPLFPCFASVPITLFNIAEVWF